MRQYTFLAWILGLVAALVLGGCSSGSVATGTASDIPAGTSQGVEYALGNGDELRVVVFNEPELSGAFTVDGTGSISMPLIGTVNVVGMTVPQFQRTVEARLADGYLISPRVSAEVTSSRPYYILGEVNRPDQYTYSPGLTAMNAIAAAGGFTYRANRREVFIRSEGDTAERTVDLTATTPVRPGDTIRVGERIF